MDRRTRAALAKCTDHRHSQNFPVRYSTSPVMGGYQVSVHLPTKAHALMTDAQKAHVVGGVCGNPEPTEQDAKDSAAVWCIAVLVSPEVKILDASYNPIEPPDIVVCFSSLTSPPPIHIPRCAHACMHARWQPLKNLQMRIARVCAWVRFSVCSDPSPQIHISWPVD
jgi:hypothetical protein